MMTILLPTNENQLSRPTRLLPIGLLMVFVGLSALFGYQQLFSTFASYDDEGYVMLSLQSFMQGHPLYDETYSQYGPAFFQVQYFLHDVLELDISHDSIRLKTLIFWLFVSLLSAAAVARLTRKTWPAVLTFGLVFPHLDRLCLEPGHPQEFCGLCLIAIIALATNFESSANETRLSRRVEFGIMGGLIAAVVLTKINVGIILGLPFGLALLMCAPRTRISKSLFVVLLLAAFGLLGLIAFQLGFWPPASSLPLIVGIGLASAIFAGWAGPTENQITYQQILVTLLGFGLVGIWVVTIAILKGSTISGLADGIVFQHLSFGNFFFSPAPLHALTLACGLTGLGLAIYCRFHAFAAVVSSFLLTCLVFCSAVTALVQSYSTPTVGFDDRGMAGLLASFATGLCWAILVPLRRRESEFPRFGRMALCLTAVFQPLVAYPTPGTQMAFGTFLLLLAGIVAFSDLVDYLSLARESEWARRANLAVGALCLVVLSTLVMRSVDLHTKRSELACLNLPGAMRLRLPERQVEAIRSIVHRLNQESDTFIFAENARNSFYFWTGKRPPTAINATAWPFMLNSVQQEQIIEALSQFDRVLVVRDRVEWPLPSHAPLLQWIESNFEFDSTEGPFEIWAPIREKVPLKAVLAPLNRLR